MTKLDVKDFRSPDYPIQDLLLTRWSPRAMSGEPLEPDQLMTLFEAARWAPSAGNIQDRLFLYAYRGTPAFEQFFSLLAPGNQEWCAKAGVLIVAFSDSLLANGKPNPWHAFDTGLAVENLLLQACIMDLVAHPMAGFSYDRAKSELNVPERFVPQCMIAIGHHGDPSELSEYNQVREQPNQRKPIQEIIHEGGFEKEVEA